MLQLLAERHELNTQHGRPAFAILLFQDLAVMPMLAILPLLGASAASQNMGDTLLGAAKGPGAPQGLERALAVPGAHVHVYGKAMSSAGRKMGHVTALGQTLIEAETAAQKAAEAIVFGAK